MATPPNLARDLKSVRIEDENGSSDEELDDSLMAVGDPQTRRMTSGPRREQMPGLGPSNEDDYKAWVPEDNDPSLLEEVQPAGDLERNDLQREEGHVAIAGRRTEYIHDQEEKRPIKAVMNYYLHVLGFRSGFGHTFLFHRLMNVFRHHRSRCVSVQDAAPCVKEVCTVMADLLIQYMMNNSQDSQNSHQEALLDLLSAGCRGCMTVPEFLRNLRQIVNEAVQQAFEEDSDEEDSDEEDSDEEDSDEEDSDEEEANEEEADLVIQQGEGDQGPQPDSQAPVSKHGGVDDSGPDPAPEPGDASDSQDQQGRSRKFV